jgi:hypothetical protein
MDVTPSLNAGGLRVWSAEFASDRPFDSLYLLYIYRALIRFVIFAVLLSLLSSYGRCRLCVSTRTCHLELLNCPLVDDYQARHNDRSPRCIRNGDFRRPRSGHGRQEPLPISEKIIALSRADAHLPLRRVVNRNQEALRRNSSLR